MEDFQITLSSFTPNFRKQYSPMIYTSSDQEINEEVNQSFNRDSVSEKVCLFTLNSSELIDIPIKDKHYQITNSSKESESPTFQTNSKIQFNRKIKYSSKYITDRQNKYLPEPKPVQKLDKEITDQIDDLIEIRQKKEKVQFLCDCNYENLPSEIQDEMIKIINFIKLKNQLIQDQKKRKE